MTLHAHTHICRSTSTLDLNDHDSVIAIYEFEHPIYQAEDEGKEYCEIPGELAMLLMQEEKAIQLHEEPVEVINLGTEASQDWRQLRRWCQKQVGPNVARLY